MKLTITLEKGEKLRDEKVSRHVLFLARAPRTFRQRNEGTPAPDVTVEIIDAAGKVFELVGDALLARD